MTREAENTFPAILLDLKPGTMYAIRYSPGGPLLRPDNFGHYAEGADLVDQICDYNQGFQIAHLLDGGTRPGMGTLLISRIKEDFPDRMMTASDAVAGPCNAMLFTKHWIHEADETFCFDTAVISGVSVCLYFPSELNPDMCKLLRWFRLPI
ncbi:tubulin nucleotide-binding domain-like protein [Aspergillus brunneoviolaceus CBS 621.78]|uniref:Tubulin nucleotide-binding domain-like protein n=1 Tax=Aspergillus brunneoviolaceus CBS 621.78 TaxID=1450534 RepID=A0ACD1G3F3_9EURO|nr:tubulin nucleotide-binding domain-like protein [Aspergillus brunneoviolaceus CBS 621.78]RAH43765.1 tubulin nucleotide-binding domain-like protein [Aspergillus brunneoviolaceus CBS 621.78]